jgi:hypothetical protein
LEFQIRKIYVPDTTTEVFVEPLSDIHVGSKFFDKKKFIEVRDRIRDDPNRYTFILGDIFDATLPDNKFFDQNTQDPELDTLQKQFTWILNALLPIRHKILGVHCGNHDERVRLKHFDDMVAKLVDRLNRPDVDGMDDYPVESGVPRLGENNLLVAFNGNTSFKPGTVIYLWYMAMTRLVFVRKFPSGEEHVDSSVEFHTWHGGYSGRRIGGNLNNQEDLATGWSADVYLSGHTHQIVIDKKPKVSMDQYGHLQEITKIFAVCGTFLRAYNEGTMSYAELKAFQPQRVGTITISIFPYTRKLQAHE